MLTYRDCVAMSELSEAVITELARREHLPFMVAVCCAVERGKRLAGAQPAARVPSDSSPRGRLRRALAAEPSDPPGGAARRRRSAL